MSYYATMDHAGWVEQHNAAQNSYKKRRKDWTPAPEKLSPFQARVFDILGMVYGDIYNAPIAWSSVEWNAGGGVAVTLNRVSFATFDFDQLTKLVFLCHEARIRCALERAGPRGLRLYFHQRSQEGGFSRRHPNLAEAVAAFREYLPRDHRILYASVEPALSSREGGLTTHDEDALARLVTAAAPFADRFGLPPLEDADPTA